MEAKEQNITDNLGLLVVRSEITDKQIDQLITYANSDQEVILNTSDPTRFKDKQSFDKWKEKGRSIYIMTDQVENGNLLGIIWFGKDHLPDKNYPDNLTNDEKSRYGFTFAIRVYDKARGLRLSQKFMSAAFDSFKRTNLFRESQNNSIWLETSADNLAAVSAYTKFGFEQVAGPDEKGKVIMIYKKNL
jgi:ribosomal protein S18 acetylase RimI-like enzyme